MKTFFIVLFHLSVLAYADVVAYPGAENESPLKWKAARCEWKGDDLVIQLGEEDEKPYLRLSLKAFEDYAAYMKKHKALSLKLYNEGFGEALYTDVDGFTRHIPNHVEEATCALKFTAVRYDGNFLESFNLTLKCEGFRAKGIPFQRSLEIKDKDPIHCGF